MKVNTIGSQAREARAWVKSIVFGRRDAYKSDALEEQAEAIERAYWCLYRAMSYTERSSMLTEINAAIQYLSRVR